MACSQLSLSCSQWFSLFLRIIGSLGHESEKSRSMEQDLDGYGRDRDSPLGMSSENELIFIPDYRKYIGLRSLGTSPDFP